MSRRAQLVAIIWIFINLYVWAVMSVPPDLIGRLPPRLQAYHAYNRALLARVFYRPYVWSPEGK